MFDEFFFYYYLDDKAPVTDTNIPSHLDQMLGILLQEEREREFGVTGPCMEYLLHHKILETLYTLGKADVSPSSTCSWACDTRINVLEVKKPQVLNLIIEVCIKHGGIQVRIVKNRKCSLHECDYPESQPSPQML